MARRENHREGGRPWRAALSGALIAVAACSAAGATEIRYTETATVSGSYEGPNGSGTFDNETLTMTVVGDTAQTGVAFAPDQTSGQPYFDTVRLTYGSASVGSVSGALDQNFFGGVANVAAFSNSNSPYTARVVAVTELESDGHLGEGGFAYSTAPNVATWDGVSSLPPTYFTSLDPVNDGVDLAFKNGTLVSFSARSDGLVSADILTGATPGDALLPNAPAANGYGFTFDAETGQTVYIDPAVAIGYDYRLGAGSPFITGAIFPDIAGSNYQIFALDDFTHALPVTFTPTAGGLSVDFTSLAAYADGIDGFRLIGINPGAGLDPTSAPSFVTGLSFAGSGPVQLDQVALAAPEPGAWAMLLLGFGGLGTMMRCRRRTALAA